MHFDAIFAALRDLQGYLLAAAFALARMIGLITLFPVFSRVRLTGLLRTSVALALVVPIVPATFQALDKAEMSTLMVVLYMMKEVVVGVALAIAMGIPFWAAEAAGEILDLQRGSSMATLIDPMMTHETGATGTFLAIVMVTLYMAGGGLHLTLDALYDSYDLWPIDRLLPVFSAGSATIFLDLLTRVLTMALTLVFPLIVALLLSDILLGFMARAAPHLNVFALSLVVKTLVFALILVPYAAFLLSYMRHDMGALLDAAKQIKAIGCLDCSQ
jgi:type III secretion protein T